MSQFLLAQGVDSTLLPSSVETLSVEGNRFLEVAGAQIFATEDMQNIVAINIDGEDFDSIFLQAQRNLVEGSDYEETRLSEVLELLSQAAECFALWYGDDYVDLEYVNNFQGLTQAVYEGLLSPSVETYVMYKKENKT